MTDTPVAFFIMYLTIAASLVAMFVPGFGESAVYHPYSVARGRRIHTLITGNLIHGGFAHLAFNMLSYYFFAFPLERIIGSERFLVVYLASMLVADIPSLVAHRNHRHYRTLGASGAVSGVIFSMILFHPTMKMALLFLPVPIPAYLFGPLYLLYSYFAARSAGDNINHEAHLWGAVGGVASTLVCVPSAAQVFAQSMGWNIL
ncbi:MAG: rhomboid family intramembrane serine protease [Candidatus Kapaibacterium sp.]